MKLSAQQQFDMLSRSLGFLDWKPSKADLKGFDFDALLQILTDKDVLKLVLPPRSLSGILETVQKIIDDSKKPQQSESDTRIKIDRVERLRFVVERYWYLRTDNSKPQGEGESARVLPFINQIRLCEKYLTETNAFQGLLRNLSEGISWQLRECTDIRSQSDKDGNSGIPEVVIQELEYLKLALEAIKTRATEIQERRERVAKDKLPKSINDAPYYYQMPNKAFELMQGIWKLVIEPLGCPGKHVHYLSWVIEKWAEGTIRHKDKNIKMFKNDWYFKEYQIVVGKDTKSPKRTNETPAPNEASQTMMDVPP